MFLSEPPATNYDLRFSLAGFPIRISPWFWLASLILGAGGSMGQDGFDERAGMKLLVWVGVVFVSILIHELGHALAFRRFGLSARIVMYMFGGMAIPEQNRDPWRRPARLDAGADMSVCAAGPFAGFVLAGLVVAIIFAAGGTFKVDLSAFPPWRFSLPPNVSDAFWYLVAYMLYVNIFWGLVNLLPVYPLDGGQIANAWFSRFDPQGTIKALQLSFVTSLVVAIGGYVMLHSVFMALFFGSMAYSNYMTLRYAGGGY